MLDCDWSSDVCSSDLLFQTEQVRRERFERIFLLTPRVLEVAP
jgi:type II secretory pathway component GspD/PulD (secretin)